MNKNSTFYRIRNLISFFTKDQIGTPYRDKAILLLHGRLLEYGPFLLLSDTIYSLQL